MNKLFIVLLTLIITGCVTLPNQPKPDDPEYAPVLPERMGASTHDNNGSIYNSQTSMSLFETIRAKRVGDVITILLTERTNASKKATTTNRKVSDTNVSDPTIMGTKASVLAAGAFPLVTKNNTLAFDFEADRTFRGEGESKQNNELQGSITVMVTAVLPNGNLVVAGEKWITINQGEEFIRLKGIIRPTDINPDNTILSTKLANARIIYSGRGAVNDSNAMGWLSKFFNSPIWPF